MEGQISDLGNISGGALTWNTPQGAHGAMFTTRVGGISEGPYESLNVGAHVGDDIARVLENRASVCAIADAIPETVYSVEQVHGNEVHVAHPDALELGSWGIHRPTVQADAIVFSEGVAVVMVADCLPLIVVGSKASAVVHLGWRGVASDLVDKVMTHVGTPIGAAIGPHIRDCCYGVQDDVAAQFDPQFCTSADGSKRLNLERAVLAKLQRHSVVDIQTNEICTSCDSSFFSHRRDGGKTGRQCLIAWFVPGQLHGS